MQKAVVKVVSILQKDAFSYDVLVRERDWIMCWKQDTLTGWVTDLNGMTFFICVLPMNSSTITTLFWKDQQTSW